MPARTLQTMKSIGYILYKVRSGTYASRSLSSFKCLSSVKFFTTLNSATTHESFLSRNPNKFPDIVIKTSNRSYSGTVKSPLEEFDDFCKNGNLKEAVDLLEQNKIRVDMDRYFVLMNKCGESQALEEAKQVHHHLKRSLPHLDVYVHNKILDMYSKCGSMKDAYEVFDKMPKRNLTSWDTMITWLAKNNHGEEAIEMFTEFKRVGLKPDNQMFHGVFAACSVVGDMKEGLLHFKSMGKNYNLVPSMDDYVRVVNMLGSSGYLNDALEFIEKLPMEPSVEIWEIMMNQCRVHGDLELGDRCAEIVNLLDPSRLDEQSKEDLMPKEKVKEKEKEKEKEERNSSMCDHPVDKLKTKSYEFKAWHTSHPDHEKIYNQLCCLKQTMKEAGYVPQTRFVLHDVDEESREEALLLHGERLAFSQGLLTSKARSPIRIVKDYRICVDCHNAFKIISKLVGRFISVRDHKRFHNFQNGVCSCRDYW